MPLDRGAYLAIHCKVVPDHVPARDCRCHAGAFGTQGIAVDKDQTPGFDGVGIRIHRDRALEDDFAATHVVAVKVRGFVRFEGTHVQAVNKPADRSWHRSAANLEIVSVTGEQGYFRHPDYVGFQEVGYGRSGIGGLHQPVAPGYVQFSIEHHRHRLARTRALKVAVESADPLDLCMRIGWQHPNGIAHVQRCADKLPGNTPEVLIRAVDPLRYQPEGHTVVAARGESLQRLQNRVPLVPRGVGRIAHHVAAVNGADRDHGDFGHAQS